MEPFSRLTPTKSEETKREYVKCFERLRTRFGNELGKKDLAPDEVVAHLILRHKTFAARTWRHYKASVVYWLETYSPESETAIEELRKHGSAGLPNGGANTSARKRKDVPDSIWTEIKYAIRERIKRDHKHAAKLLSVCEATLATGLRPNEWAFSELTRHDENHRLVLRVRNSKHSNGRGNGEYREMYVDELNADELRAVREALEACAVADDGDVDVHEQAAKLQLALKHELEAARALAVAGQRRPRSSITLYSFRHQFSANAKRTFENPVLTAALLGHSSTHTGFQHYGKRRNASSRVRVYPTEASVAAVQNRYLETYREHVAQRGVRRTPGPMNT